jgi:hypothetical protein
VEQPEDFEEYAHVIEGLFGFADREKASIHTIITVTVSDY